MPLIPVARKIWICECKNCGKDIPANVTEHPTAYIAVRCPLCRDVRRYLPTQVGLGYVHADVRKLVRERQLV